MSIVFAPINSSNNSTTLVVGGISSHQNGVDLFLNSSIQINNNTFLFVSGIERSRFLYWNEEPTDLIRKSLPDIPLGQNALNRTDIISIFDPAANVTLKGLTYDRKTEKVFVNDSLGFIISSMNPDGSDVTPILGASEVNTMAVHPESGLLFYTQFNTIRRSEVDGSNDTFLKAQTDQINGMSVHQGNDKLFYTIKNGTTAHVRTIDMDGFNDALAFTYPTSLNSSVNIAVDHINNKIYYVDEDTIKKANLDGTSVQVVISGITEQTEIELDDSSKRLYISNFNPSSGIGVINVDPIGVLQNFVDISRFSGTSPKELIFISPGLLQESIDLYLKVPEGNNIPLFIDSDAHSSGSIPLFCQAIGTIQNNIDLVFPAPFVNNNTTLFIDGIVISSFLYWTESLNDKIRRSFRNIPLGQTASSRTDPEIVFDPLADVALKSLAYDRITRTLFANDNIANTIIAMDFDGNNPAPILNVTSVNSMDVHHESGLLFYTQGANITRSDIDGSNTIIVTSPGFNTHGLSIHQSSGHVYYTTRAGTTASVRRVNLDGSNNVIAFTYPTSLNSWLNIQIDPINDLIYYVDGDSVRRSNLDGSNQEIVTSGVSERTELAFDEIDQFLYLSNFNAASGIGSIRFRSIGPLLNFLDLSLIGVVPPEGLVFINPSTPSTAIPLFIRGPETDALYFTDSTLDKVFKSTIIPPPFLDTVTGPNAGTFYKGIEFSVIERKIYWIDSSSGIINKSNTDGSNQQIVVSGLSNPSFLTIHNASGLLIWADQGLGTIKSSDLNGSGITTIVSGGGISPIGVESDQINNHIYWSDFATGQIRRVNLDGSNNILINAPGVPRDLFIDNTTNKLYWSDSNNNWIKRANLDGSSEEIVVSNTGDLTGITIDIENQRMFFTDLLTNKVQFVDLNPIGTPQDFITNLSDPQSIVFVPSLLINDGIDLFVSGTGSIELIQDNITLFMDSTIFNNITLFTEGFVKSKFLYWDEESTDLIRRSDPDIPLGQTALNRTDIQTIFNPTSNVTLKGLAYDKKTQKVFVNDSASFVITSMGRDGENPTAILGSAEVNSMDVHSQSGFLFYTQGTNIRRFDINASSTIVLTNPGINTNGLSVHQSSDHVYYTTKTGAIASVRRVDINGTNNIVSFTYGASLNSTINIAIDSINDKIYYVDANTIRRSNLDGSSSEIILSGVTEQTEIELDEIGKKLYISNFNASSGIGVISIDPIGQLQNFVDLSLLPSSSPKELFFVSPFTSTDSITLFINSFSSHNDNATLFIESSVSLNNFVTLFASGVGVIQDNINLIFPGNFINNNIPLSLLNIGIHQDNISLFVSGGVNNDITLFTEGFIQSDFLYWAEVNNTINSAIRKSLPDIPNGQNAVNRTDIQTILDNTPTGSNRFFKSLRYDQTNKRLLFIDAITAKVNSIDLDGTNDTNLFLQAITSLGIYQESGLLYRAIGGIVKRTDSNELNDTFVFATNTTGTDVADISVHQKNKHVYISYSLDPGTQEPKTRVSRIDLDGGNNIIVFDYLSSNGRNIEVDSINDKIYFTDTDTLKRADLDGSNIETVFSNISTVAEAEMVLDNRSEYIYLSNYTNNESGIAKISTSSFAVENFIDLSTIIIDSPQTMTFVTVPFISNSISLFMGTRDVINQNISLFIENSISVDNTSTLFASGIGFTQDNINLVFAGKLVDNNATLFIDTFDIINNNIELFIDHDILVSESIPLFLLNISQQSGIISLSTEGNLNPSITNSLDLFEKGRLTQNGNITLFNQPHETVSGDISLFIFGAQQGNFIGFIKTEPPPSTNIDLFINGKPSGQTLDIFPLINNIPLFITNQLEVNTLSLDRIGFIRTQSGVIPGNITTGDFTGFIGVGNSIKDNIDIFIKGHPSGQDPLGIEINNNSELFIDGLGNVLSEGFFVITNNSQGFISVHNGILSSIPIFIDGIPFIENNIILHEFGIQGNINDNIVLSESVFDISQNNIEVFMFGVLNTSGLSLDLFIDGTASGVKTNESILYVHGF